MQSISCENCYLIFIKATPNFTYMGVKLGVVLISY